MKKIGNYTLSGYVRCLIGKVDDSSEEQLVRLDQLMALAQSQKLGLPRPMALNDAFFEIYEGLDKSKELKI